MDLDILLMRKIEENGGDKDDFNKLSALITRYAAESGASESGIALIVIDSLDCGMTRDGIETQLRVYQSKINRE